MIYILMALFAGGLIVFTRVINSNLAVKIGIFNGTFFNYFVGLIFALGYLGLESMSHQGGKIRFEVLPWWAWLGGLTGVLVLMLSNYITPKISSFVQTLLVFIGQLFAGIVIDYFTSGNVSIGKVLGGALVLAGLIYNTNVDRKFDRETARKLDGKDKVLLSENGNK